MSTFINIVADLIIGYTFRLVEERNHKESQGTTFLVPLGKDTDTGRQRKRQEERERE